MNEGGFPGAGNSGEAAEQAERDGDVELAEVVSRGTADFQLRLARLTAGLRDGDGAGAGKPGESSSRNCGLRIADCGFGRTLLWNLALGTWDFNRPLIDDFTAVLAGSGAEVDEVVGGAHDGFLVFDDDERVSLVAQAVHDADEAMDVARVEADGWFIEDKQGSC